MRPHRLPFLAFGLIGAVSALPALAATFEYRHPMTINVSPPAEPAPEEPGPEEPVPEIPVSLSLSQEALLEGTRGQFYSFDMASRLTIAGDNPPALQDVAWRLTEGELPASLELTAQGILQGTPARGQTVSIGLEAAAAGTTAQASYTLVINKVPLQVLQLDAHGNRTCALTSDRKVYCWGSGAKPDLGVSFTPEPVQGLPADVASISVGGSHACALTQTGAAYCWGRNDHGQLGDTTLTHRGTAAPVKDLWAGVTSIYAGGYGTCAVLSGGALRCWGDNTYLQVDSSGQRKTEPTPVAGMGSGVTFAAIEYSHTCAIQAGVVKCWGGDFYGQRGEDALVSNASATPVAVTGLPSGIRQLGMGTHHSCALSNGGEVWCWGHGAQGQTGNASFPDAHPLPSRVSGLSTVSSLSMHGGHSTCAALSDGSAKCWGNGARGQLGNGTFTTATATPVTVQGLTLSAGAKLVAGATHACALLGPSELKCWGNNAAGQVGDGTTEHRTSPVSVPLEY